MKIIIQNSTYNSIPNSTYNSILTLSKTILNAFSLTNLLTLVASTIIVMMATTTFVHSQTSTKSLTLEQFNRTFSADLTRQFKQNDIPGAAYVIVKNGKIIALETFGHIDQNKTRKIDPNTVFRLASVSKTFAATLTTMLAQEKVLNLSDPITQYVPEFSLATENAAQKIQLRHLLSHTSGLMPNAYDNLLHEDWNLDKIISRFDRIKPLCSPDRCYGYQNIAYSLLQPAIEASQPETFNNLLQQRIFTPLKMHNASVGQQAFLAQTNRATPHTLKKRVNTGKKNKQGKIIRKYIWRASSVSPDFYKVAPAAGVNASITDLAQWLIANLGYRKNVLSDPLLTELTTPRIKTRRDIRKSFWREHLIDAHYGYGWRIYQFKDYPVIYHSGWVAGFKAEIGYSPDLDLGFALLLNAESNISGKISAEFWSHAKSL